MDRVEAISVGVAVVTIILIVLAAMLWRPFSSRPHGEGVPGDPGAFVGGEPGASHHSDGGGHGGGGGHAGRVIEPDLMPG